jgi:hypothetical protein
MWGQMNIMLFKVHDTYFKFKGKLLTTRVLNLTTCRLWFELLICMNYCNALLTGEQYSAFSWKVKNAISWEVRSINLQLTSLCILGFVFLAYLYVPMNREKCKRLKCHVCLKFSFEFGHFGGTRKRGAGPPRTPCSCFTFKIGLKWNRSQFLVLVVLTSCKWHKYDIFLC